MPTYEFQCKSCNEIFVIQAAIDELNEKTKGLCCPYCGGKIIQRKFSAFNVVKPYNLDIKLK